MKKQHLEQLKKTILEIRVFEEWNITIGEYEENFDATIDSIKKTFLEKLQHETLDKLRVQVKELLFDKMNNINEGFWADFNREFALFSIMCLKPLKESLSVYYKLDNEECNRLIESLEEELYTTTLKGVEKKSKDLSTVAVEKFKEDFWFEEGLPRKWVRIEEIKIDELFIKSKKKAENLFIVFNEFKLVKYPLKTRKSLYL